MVDADWWSMLRALDEPVAAPESIGREPILRALVAGTMPESMLAALHQRVARGEGDALAVPRDFDHAGTQGRFERLTERLSEAYGCPCDSALAPDSACFGSIRIPAKASRSHTKRTRIPLPLVVSVSAFGGLATYAASSPSDQKPYLHPDDRRQIELALAGLGYLVVPEHILAPYDGPNGWVFGPGADATWFTRFFNHL